MQVWVDKSLDDNGTGASISGNIDNSNSKLRIGGAVGTTGDVGFYGDIDQAQVLNYFDTSLPVKLYSFTATSNNDVVMLFWRTETEVDNVGYSIYRAEEKDGNYTKIGFVSGVGNSTMPIDYRFTDEKVSSGMYFYTLQAGDFIATRKMIIVK